MDNKSITNKLKLVIQLMELHDENPFKIRSYQSAVTTIDRGVLNLAGMDKHVLQEIKGIGKNIAEVISSFQESQTHPYLEELLGKTPEGLLEVLQIKGLGPKKIKILWKDLNVTSTHELMEACQSGQVAKLKGFGERTQQGIILALEYTASNEGKWLYADIKEGVVVLQQVLEQEFGKEKVTITGDFARYLEILDQIEWIIATDDRKAAFAQINGLPSLIQDRKLSSPFKWRGKVKELNLKVIIHFTPAHQFTQEKLLRTGSRAHLLSPVQGHQTLITFFRSKSFESEVQAYEEAGLSYIPPELREGQFEMPLAKEGRLPKLLEMEDLKGSLHNHSTYSDGKNSLRDMATYCKSLGYEYLGIADHSKSAFYAGGLEIEKVMEQQEEIKTLNQELAPFRIFSGIESDILIDGSLDYTEDILASFDFIVSSIHTSLGMNMQKATARLVKAIQNPYTTILGHPTGRLLLRRQGYPIDHKLIIDACAANQVVIEINANPWRLDLDWRWVNYALEKGVKLSINPDAHEKEAYADMKYGVLIGRKGGLTKEMTLNALSAEELAAYFADRKKRC
ncbi:MAG: helix-hairpin-helix domain-containing protein [Anditalea sp.]